MGAAGFIVFDDTVDPVAIAEGVSRFLAVESCGQCTPCKSDGLVVAEPARPPAPHRPPTGATSQQVDDCLATITDGARCSLAHQHQQVVVEPARAVRRRRAAPRRTSGRAGRARVTIAPLVDLVDGEAVVDRRQATKNPDWTHDRPDSGRKPRSTGCAAPDHRGRVPGARGACQAGPMDDDRRPVELLSAVTLTTAAMAPAVAFYEALGFERLYGGPDAPFTSYRIGRSFLNVQLDADYEPPTEVWVQFIFWVDDVDAMYERSVAAGFAPLMAPSDAPWGERYFHLRDPPGHELSFARPLAEP